MEERSDVIKEYKLFYDTSLAPLLSAGKQKQAADLLESELTKEDRPDFRSFHLMNLVGVLIAMGDHSGSLDRARQMAREFPDDPLAWSNLAHHLHLALHQPEHMPTTEEKHEALDLWQAAQRVSKEQNEFYLMVSFSLCRALADWEMWPELEQRMADILEHLDGPPCRNDVPTVEGDWTSKIPDGKIDGGILKSYRSVVGQSTQNRLPNAR